MERLLFHLLRRFSLFVSSAVLTSTVSSTSPSASTSASASMTTRTSSSSRISSSAASATLVCNTDSSGLSHGAIAGVVIGAVVGAILTLLKVICCGAAVRESSWTTVTRHTMREPTSTRANHPRRWRWATSPRWRKPQSAVHSRNRPWLGREREFGWSMDCRFAVPSTGNIQMTIYKNTRKDGLVSSWLDGCE